MGNGLDSVNLKTMAKSFFENLFQSTQVQSYLKPKFQSSRTMSAGERESIVRPITEMEVKSNFFQMDPIKSPGPDGIQPVFYQRYWEEIKDSIVQFCSKCFNHSEIPQEINSSYITLIPKTDHPETMVDLRPIGLCNTIYKLITKIITNRLRPIMNNLISPLQSSFIKGRGIEDNIIVVKEMAHIFHKAKKGKNIMALKLDLTKAYDSLE